MTKNPSAVATGIILTIAVIFSSAATCEASRHKELLEMGIADYEDESYEEAVESLLEAYEKDPMSSVAAMYLGLSHKEILEYNKARRYLEEATGLDPSLGEAYLSLGEVLFELEIYPEAGEALTKARNLGANPARATFLLGLIHLKTEDNDAAIEEFKAAAAIDSDFEQRSLYYTAVAYLKKGMRKDARDAYTKTVEFNPDSSTGSQAARALKAMKQQRPFKFSIGASFYYDDNVVLKPSAEIAGVAISDESDTKTVLTFNGSYTKNYKLVSLKAAYSAYQSIYQDLDQYNILAHSLSLTPSTKLDSGRLGLRVGYDYYYLDDEKYLQMISARPTYSFSWNKKHHGYFSVGYSDKDYLQQPFTPDEDRGGSNISAGYTHAVTVPGWPDLLVGYRYDSEDTDGDNWVYTGHMGTLYVSQQVAEAWRLSLRASVYKQDYDNAHTFYDTKRRDTTVTIAPSLSFRYKALVANLQYTFTRVDSNILVFDYERNVFGLGATYNF